MKVVTMGSGDLGWLNWSSSSLATKLSNNGMLETSPSKMANQYYINKQLKVMILLLYFNKGCMVGHSPSVQSSGHICTEACED
jgi:hypothetical protein